MRLNENEGNIGRKRYIEVGFNEFYKVLECAVRATLTEDAVIFYDDPIDNNKFAGFGSQKVSLMNTAKGYNVTNGFIVKQDIDWVIDFHTREDWRDMIIDKEMEIGTAFIEWCDKENDMIIVVIDPK